jgi:DNA-binding CsgD family transcriptional regulator
MPSQSRKSPVEKLSAREADQVRLLMDAHGDDTIAERCGVDIRTLTKAVAQRNVSRLTASVIRSWLPSRI